MSYQASEADRRLANIVRFGTIAEIDLVASPPVVRVDIGEADLTEWLQWAPGRAGRTRRWCPPDIDEQVIVLSPSGELADGIVVPSIYQDAFPANGDSQDLDRTTYPDGSVVEYDSAVHRLTVSVGTGSVVVNCATATVNAATSVLLDTPETTCSGNLTVQKRLTYLGGMSGSNSAGGAAASITGGVAFDGGALTHNGANVGSTHTHTEQGDGQQTSTPH